MNSDILLTYHNSFLDGVTLNAAVGGNMMTSKLDMLSNAANGLITPGVYKLANAISAIEFNQKILNKMVNSVYFTANLAYKNKLFLDISGRNDCLRLYRKGIILFSILLFRQVFYLMNGLICLGKLTC